MVYQEAGIPRYDLGQVVRLREIRDTHGESIHPGILLYPPSDGTFLSQLTLSHPLPVNVIKTHEVQPDFFGYKATHCPGTDAERIFVNQFFHYSRSLEFLCGIEPVNHMDYLWYDDSNDRMYIDEAYLIRCYTDPHGMYSHLSVFLDKSLITR